MRRSTRWSAVALAVLTLAACHSKGATRQLSTTEYKDRVNRICADARNITSTIAPPSLKATADDVKVYAKQLQQVLGPHVRAIEEIPVPPVLRPDMLAINDLFNALLRNLADQIAAADKNDGRGILAAGDRIASLQSQLDTRANAIGLESCASA